MYIHGTESIWEVDTNSYWAGKEIRCRASPCFVTSADSGGRIESLCRKFGGRIAHKFASRLRCSENPLQKPYIYIYHHIHKRLLFGIMLLQFSSIHNLKVNLSKIYLVVSSHLCLSNDISPWGFLTKILYILNFSFSPYIMYASPISSTLILTP
jgi:hypothetical protein